jgi:hypothetical protein
LDQYKIQLLHTTQNVFRAPPGSNFKTSNFNQAVDEVLLDAQQDKFMLGHKERLTDQKKLTSQPTIGSIKITAVGSTPTNDYASSGQESSYVINDISVIG